MTDIVPPKDKDGSWQYGDLLLDAKLCHNEVIIGILALVHGRCYDEQPVEQRLSVSQARHLSNQIIRLVGVSPPPEPTARQKIEAEVREKRIERNMRDRKDRTEGEGRPGYCRW